MVSEIVIAGGSGLYDTASLSPTWADNERIGGPMTLADLADVARAAQRQIQLDGYVFTRVYAPQRLSDVVNGVATLELVEAQIINVTVEESAEPVGPALDQLKAMAQQLAGEGGVNPHIEHLERVLLLMRDLPGITRATAVPARAPGYERGQLDLVINVERKPFSGVFFVDNAQSPTVGPGLVGVAAQAGSFGPGGDTLRFTAVNSFWDEGSDFGERHLGQVEYSRRLGSTGLVFDARALYSASDPGGAIAQIDLNNRQYEIEVGLEYPIIRTRSRSLWVRASAEIIDSRSEVGANNDVLSKDRLRVVELMVRGAMRDRTGYTRGSFGVRQGLDILNAHDSDDDPNRSSRADGKADATVLFAEIEREQVLAQNFTAYAKLAGQVSSTALLSAEEFAIGGSAFGRGYDPSEFLGDAGIGATLELRYSFDLSDTELGLDTEEIGPLMIYAFGDYGRIFNRSTGSPRSEDIYSVGGGFRLTLPQDASLNFELAKPLTNLQRTQDDDFRFYFRAQKRF